ncbi:MAG: helix-turn-helix domain-containing protein [Rhodomicrobium sp.]
MSLTVANIAAQSEKTKAAHLPALVCESILSGTANKAYLRNQEIFIEGDAKQNVYQVESGAVCLYRTMADGRRQIFDFAFAGDIIGLGASGVHSCSAQAIGTAMLKSIPLSRLYRLATEDSRFALDLYRAVSAQLDATRDLLLSLGQQSAIERVAIFLLTLSKRNAANGKNANLLSIPMTRSDIADLLGTTIETVSRSLSKLRQERLIEIIRGSLIQVINMEGLKSAAGQAEATFH